ncbi:ubiquitin-like domain-containing protein CIP73 isoform X2 [Phragmites australis]|uniref:ubiquitin-like domain-containing protein CIP73 isoform X2 n=1 Tax=Phragmites australis TaxID=29695 RepID=UPI002D76599B|nr:ubiquitin-like domain-containing protein CIP73 isoform X2 [Phragmites australis]
MADDASHGASSSTVKPAEDPESTIEINIKTLDSQVHKLRVKKNVSVSVLKEKIVDATGVPLDQQRLIFRGRVLKDDHLLSEYHLEDGYTLHLVARRAAEAQHSSGTSEGNTHANVNVAGNGGLLDDISRSVRDILGTLGVAMSGGVTNTAFSVPLATAPEGANNVHGGTQPVNPAQPGFSVLNHQIHVTQLQPTGAIPRNMVIPDSLMTLSEYMERMDQVLQNNGTPPSRDSESQQRPVADDAYLNPRFPSPEVLAQVIERAQQLLGGSAASALSHIAQRIRSDGGIGDASVRRGIQSESVQLGIAMQHLGAMLFELGRTMMMLRTGTSPSEAFVNAGPAVYINSTGPNPIMVQPSFQNTPPFGVSNIPALGGVSGAFGIVNPSRSSGFGDPSRNINVPTSGVSAATGSSVGMATTSEGPVNGDHAVRTQGGNPSGNSAATPGLPTRTVVAAIPARSSVEAPNHVLSVFLPVQVRSQVAVLNQSTSSQGSQTAVGNESQPNSTSAVPEASVGGVAGIPSIVAHVTAHVANALAANAPVQVSSSAQNTSDQGSHPTTDSRAGVLSSSTSAATQLQNEPSGTRGSNLTSQDSNTVNVPSVNSIQKHLQTEDTHGDNVRLSCEELATTNISGDPTATCTRDIPSSISAENSVLQNKSSDGVGSQSSASGRSEPLGLGGGLIPKRPSRTSKPSGSTTDPGRDSSSVSQNQDAVLVAQQFLQGFASQNTNASRRNTTDSAPPSSMPQPTGVPPRRQGGEGQPDMGSMISGMLNNPVFGNLLSNVATQTGGSRADLRSVMEGLQNPAIIDTISNIVQNVDEQDLGSMFGSGRGQGGMDLSRMMQQMMPIVSQVLGGAGPRPVGANSGESRSQAQCDDSGEGNDLDGRSSQIDLQQACQRIEQHESPENIFSAVLGTAAQAYGEDDSIQGMLEELVSDPELTNDYLKLLVQQVRQRIQSESQSRS